MSQAFLFFFFQSGFFRLRGACALGLGRLSGFVYTHDLLTSYTGEISEVSLYLGASVSGEIRPLEAFGLFGTIGVRDLSFDKVESEYRQFASEEYGGALPFDYSGWFIQVGVRWELPLGDNEEKK